MLELCTRCISVRVDEFILSLSKCVGCLLGIFCMCGCFFFFFRLFVCLLAFFYVQVSLKFNVGDYRASTSLGFLEGE